MRVRTNIILAEEILKKIDIIAGEKHKRAAVIETALLEFIAREEAKAPVEMNAETVDKKVLSKTK